MTLIVGIKCTDGIVLVSDGAASLGTMGQMTARQPTKKLSIVKERILAGVSGPVGLGQRFVDEIEQLSDGGQLAGASSGEIARRMRAALWKHAEVEFRVAQVAAQIVGHEAASQSCLTGTLVAFPLGDEAVLFQFDHQCAPEEVTHDLPFAAIGGGQQIADPFLAFLRRIFWEQRKFTVADGIFAALWTVDHAIKTSPGGVAEPIQIIVLERDAAGHWSARELQDGDMREHRQAIADAEAHLRRFGLDFGPTEAPADAAPPEPPSSH
jgi:hypothetical protein